MHQGKPVKNTVNNSLQREDCNMDNSFIWWYARMLAEKTLAKRPEVAACFQNEQKIKNFAQLE